MQTPDSPFHDVIIAGGGPVGLFLACELQLAGCAVLVLEKAQDAHPPLKELPFGLRGLTVPTIESLDRRGLLDDLKARAASRDIPGAAHWMKQTRRAGGHFAGIQFYHDQIDSSRWAHRLPGPVSSVATDMASIEAVLTERAVALGVEIRRGSAVDAVESLSEDVQVHAGGNAFRGRWLVGCDGGRSRVRKAAGFAFSGTDPEFTGYSVQVELSDPAALRPGRQHTPTGMYTYAAPGTIAMVDFDGGACHRVELTRAHVEAVLRKVSGSNVQVTVLALATTWTDRAFQAVDYRRGRVLLAGDAAHIHSPLGGQGLNLGLGDAMNLGWKLAATIRGDAPDGLLDSYAHERHPVGAQVLDWSRAQVALMRPNRGARALAAVMRDLMETRDGVTYFAERVWSLGLRYDLGDVHPLVGRSLPDVAFADGSRANAHLRPGRGLLLEFGTDGALRTLAGRWSDRIDYVAGSVVERLGITAALVRPDGVIAWACEMAPDPAAAGLAAARWFSASKQAACRK